MTSTPAPSRIQRERRAGWEFPHSAVYVGRARGDYGKYGNPYRWSEYASLDDTARRQFAVLDFAADLRAGTLRNYPSIGEIRRELAGKDLVCWCPLDAPCHADILLDIANTTTTPTNLIMTGMHHVVLGHAFHNTTRTITPAPAAVADLVHAGYLTPEGDITDLGRATWIRDVPWHQFTPTRPLLAPPRT